MWCCARSMVSYEHLLCSSFDARPQGRRERALDADRAAASRRGCVVVGRYFTAPHSAGTDDPRQGPAVERVLHGHACLALAAPGQRDRDPGMTAQQIGKREARAVCPAVAVFVIHDRQPHCSGFQAAHRAWRWLADRDANPLLDDDDEDDSGRIVERHEALAYFHGSEAAALPQRGGDRLDRRRRDRLAGSDARETDHVLVRCGVVAVHTDRGNDFVGRRCPGLCDRRRECACQTQRQHQEGGAGHRSRPFVAASR